MPEKCTDNPRDCPMAARVEALERANEQHSDTHREIFRRLGDVEKDNAVQEAHYKSIDEKLDKLLDWQEEQRRRLAKIDTLEALSQKVADLEAKPGKRWEGIVDKSIWAVLAAVIAFFLGRVGL